MRCFTFPTSTSCGGLANSSGYNSKVLKWLATQLLNWWWLFCKQWKSDASEISHTLLDCQYDMPIKTSFMKCFILYFLRARVSTWNFSSKRQVNHVNCYRTRGLMSFNKAPSKYKKIHVADMDKVPIWNKIYFLMKKDY